MADISLKKNPAAIERERAAQKKITFQVIEREREDTLVERRQACSNHDVFRAYEKSEAEGMACCRFCGHRDWVFHEAGGGICSEDGLGVSSRSRRFA